MALNTEMKTEAATSDAKRPSAAACSIADDVFNGAHDALNRMRRAHRRGTGCHLTKEMLDSLAVTAIGQQWDQDDPRQ